jgi:hypothetical protein
MSEDDYDFNKLPAEERIKILSEEVKKEIEDIDELQRQSIRIINRIKHKNNT